MGDHILVSPPADAAERRARLAALDAAVPGLSRHASGIPNGWIPLVEEAVASLSPFLARGAVLETHQMKEKFGELRWYYEMKDPGGAAIGWDADLTLPIRAAQAASGTVCALTGRTGASIDLSTGWMLALSPEAAEMRRLDPSGFRTKLYPEP